MLQPAEQTHKAQTPEREDYEHCGTKRAGVQEAEKGSGRFRVSSPQSSPLGFAEAKTPLAWVALSLVQDQERLVDLPWEAG